MSTNAEIEMIEKIHSRDTTIIEPRFLNKNKKLLGWRSVCIADMLNVIDVVSYHDWPEPWNWFRFGSLAPEKISINFITKNNDAKIEDHFRLFNMIRMIDAPWVEYG